MEKRLGDITWEWIRMFVAIAAGVGAIACLLMAA